MKANRFNAADPLRRFDEAWDETGAGRLGGGKCGNF
jgi:hypothetical protein